MSERTTPLAFAYCARGEKYEKMAAQSVLTLKEQMPGADVRFIDPGDALAVFERFGGIEIPDAHLMGARWGGPKSLAPMLARLAIPLLPQFADCKRVVWMDCDTEVRSPDIRHLADIYMDSCMVGACRDPVLQPQDRCRNLFLRVGGPRRRCYKNSGVLLFDLERAGEDTWSAVLASILEMLRTKFRFLKYPDQDALNVCCDLFRLPQRYNVFAQLLSRDCTTAKYDFDIPVVVHYVSPARKLYKPRPEVWDGQ